MHEKSLSHTAKSAPPDETREQTAIPPQAGGDGVLQAAGLSQNMGQIPRNECGDFDIRIARDGVWFYRNSPIGRPALVKLFASVLKRDAAGDYWLETPAERGRITVEDAPFVAVEADFAGAGERQIVTLRTNLDATVSLGAEHPLILRGNLAEEPRPYVALGNGLEALVARSAFYALADRAVAHVVDGVEVLGIWSGGQFFALGPATQDETKDEAS